MKCVDTKGNKDFYLTTHWNPILFRLFISWQENFAKDMICIKRIGLAASD